MTTRYGDPARAAREYLEHLGVELSRLEDDVRTLRAQVDAQASARAVAEARILELEQRCAEKRRDLLDAVERLREVVT